MGKIKRKKIEKRNASYINLFPPPPKKWNGSKN